MMKLLSETDPFLKYKQELTLEHPSTFTDIIKEMFIIMRTNNGIGLAANQVGLKLNLFVMDKVIEGALAARYGTTGSKSVFNWIQENYPGQVDAKLYQKLQQIIESGRNDFKVAQTALIDKLRSYEVQRNQVWSGLWINIAGYPKKDLSEFKIIVTDDVTEKFNIGKDAPITMRPKSI